MEEKNTGTEAEIGEKKIYEIGFHIVPSVQDDKLGAEVSLLKEIIEKNGGLIIAEEPPKMRTLAYEMCKEQAGKYQKYNSAYFGWIKFEAVPNGALEIEKAFKTHLPILRHILVKTVRDNTMTVPRIPTYRRNEAPKAGEKKTEEAVSEVKAPVSEVELDKAIDKAIAE